MSIRGTKSARRVHARRPARGSGRIESADARRERIVRMAAPLFLKHGYDNVSIDDIIEVVGGSKATVDAWFGGKEGLLRLLSGRSVRTSPWQFMWTPRAAWRPS
jgi:AcrR family transcriptional regulator